MTQHHFDDLTPDEQRLRMLTSPYEELRRRDPTRPDFKSVLELLALLSNRGEKIDATVALTIVKRAWRTDPPEVTR